MMNNDKKMAEVVKYVSELLMNPKMPATPSEISKWCKKHKIGIQTEIEILSTAYKYL